MVVEIDECTNAEPPSHELPVATKAKYDLPKLETACRDLSSQHEKIYGVRCHFQVSEKNGDVFVHCPRLQNRCIFCERKRRGKYIYIY